ncbi:TetR family transcriptional regulator [Nocardiopsis dassonvillei]|uniref:TetR family transcriptional regulator n=1 Tax=Nocardiopsis dassonvillei TaxID=2014 RepID=UPI00366B2158
MTAVPGRLVGRPPMSARRRDAVRLEIARVAAVRFVEQGVAATTVEEISSDAGIAPRTFYRYFGGKEDAVLPLLARGVEAWIHHLAACPPDLGLGASLRQAVEAAVSEDSEMSPREVRTIQRLIRHLRTDEGLRVVWLNMHARCEEMLAVVVAERLETSPDSLRVRVLAAAANAAVRVAFEEWADAEPGLPPAGPAVEALALIDAAF